MEAVKLQRFAGQSVQSIPGFQPSMQQPCQPKLHGVACRTQADAPSVQGDRMSTKPWFLTTVTHPFVAAFEDRTRAPAITGNPAAAQAVADAKTQACTVATAAGGATAAIIPDAQAAEDPATAPSVPERAPLTPDSPSVASAPASVETCSFPSVGALVGNDGGGGYVQVPRGAQGGEQRPA